MLTTAHISAGDASISAGDIFSDVSSGCIMAAILSAVLTSTLIYHDGYFMTSCPMA